MEGIRWRKETTAHLLRSTDQMKPLRKFDFYGNVGISVICIRMVDRELKSPYPDTINSSETVQF